MPVVAQHLLLNFMNEPTPEIHSMYLPDVMTAERSFVTARRLKRAILASGLEYNAIAFHGMSGALIVPMLAWRLRKGMIVCRKPTEHSHGGDFEGLYKGGNYIIVDDFISGGDTIRGIIDTINLHKRNHEVRARTYGHIVQIVPPFNPVAIFLYTPMANTKDTFEYIAPPGLPGESPTTVSIPIFRVKE